MAKHARPKWHSNIDPWPAVWLLFIAGYAALLIAVVRLETTRHTPPAPVPAAYLCAHHITAPDLRPTCEKAVRTHGADRLTYCGEHHRYRFNSLRECLARD